MPSRGSAPAVHRERVLFLNEELQNDSLAYFLPVLFFPSRSRRYFRHNGIVTSKYTWWNFIPKTLFEFFLIVANQYFLLISILQMFTDFNPESSRITTSVPLLIVFCINMLRKFIEDLKRHRADADQNHREALVLDPRTASLVSRPWSALKPGDILKIRKKESVPVDVLLLTTSERGAVCFAETSNLDGETNLKKKAAADEIASQIGCRSESGADRVPTRPCPGQITTCPGRGQVESEIDLVEASVLRSLSAARATISYELPSQNLYSFNGTFSFLPVGGKGEGEGAAAAAAAAATPAIPLSVGNTLWRGSFLRSCDYVYGLALYTGHDTRIIQNSRDPPAKQSSVYRTVNLLIFLIFGLELVVILVSTVAYLLFSRNLSSLSYLVWPSGKRANFTAFFTFLILYNNFVPISLYVSLDFVKYFQATMMESDAGMVDPETRQPMRVRTAEINENLGQIEYVFTDKTGTLTRNVMELKKVVIGGRVYGSLESDSDGSTLPTSPDASSASEKRKVSFVTPDPSVTFDDETFLRDLKSELSVGSVGGFEIHKFLLCLILCHTVIPERNSDGSIEYRASSPDEIALVKFAISMGYDYRVSGKTITLVDRLSSSETEYETLAVNEFDSTRKRMSVVLHDPKGRVHVFCKGADSSMLPMLHSSCDKEQLMHQLKCLAVQGLRTLVCAHSILDEAEYDEWIAKYQEASTVIENRDEELSRVASLVERSLEYVGCTAIEDKLQEGVPLAIDRLIQAGIRVWMLTGDKLETAINIGNSCLLLKPSVENIIFDCQSSKEFQIEVDRFIELHSQWNKPFSLTITGSTLLYLFDDGVNVSKKFLFLAEKAQTVIACRVSPSQKAQIVSLVKLGLPSHPITLSIGDGANDVNMIQTAHVGVGIMGKEGVQAVNNSDYAIGQFRFLTNLLLVHGKDNYRRVCEMILYSFYKNIALMTSLFLYNFYNGQSGTPLYETIVKSGLPFRRRFSLLFVLFFLVLPIAQLSWNFLLALPVVVFACCDKLSSYEISQCNPKLYEFGLRSRGLTARVLINWMLNAVIHGVLPFFLSFPMMRSPLGSRDEGLMFFGTIVYTSLFIICNVKMIMMIHTWNVLMHILLWGSIIVYFLFMLVYSAILPTMSFYWVSFCVFSNVGSYAQFLLISVASLLPDIFASFARFFCCPSAEQLLMEYGSGGSHRSFKQTKNE